MQARCREFDSPWLHISDLPTPPDRRVAVRVTPDALRWVRRGHPWIWSDSVTRASIPDAPSGSLAVVFNDDRGFEAIGLWDADSPIRVRVLHRGAPTPIDQSHWDHVVSRAAEGRGSLDAAGTTGWRWLHGEADGTGGLVADRYDGTVVLKLYSTAWFAHLRPVVAALCSDPRVDRVVVRLARTVTHAAAEVGLRDGDVLFGPPLSGPVRFLEDHLAFDADVVDGQKTGWFLDQRDNRRRVGDWSAGARVLDVFSCTGGFSVHAAAGGATSVHSVDIAGPAIDAAQRSMALNRDRTAGSEHRTTVGDAFEVMAACAARGETYDIVVVDPPSFASRDRDRDRAIRAYRKLTELALDLLTDGGRLFQASCSSRVGEDDLIAVIDAALRARGASLSDRGVHGHGIDHPVTFAEGHYLTAVTGLVHHRQ